MTSKQVTDTLRISRGTLSNYLKSGLITATKTPTGRYIYDRKSVFSIINGGGKKKTITKIIIGKNENWKQNINIGTKNNRQFTSIPHATFIEMIQYKAQMAGIETITTQEAYTSKCSALDLEPICKHEKYVGKRKKRGLFVTATGKLINADANGALNIARLGSVLGNEIKISDSILSCVSQPKKLNILYNKSEQLKQFSNK